MPCAVKFSSMQHVEATCLKYCHTLLTCIDVYLSLFLV
jgi:hypothetical protein